MFSSVTKISCCGQIGLFLVGDRMERKTRTALKLQARLSHKAGTQKHTHKATANTPYCIYPTPYCAVYGVQGKRGWPHIPFCPLFPR